MTDEHRPAAPAPCVLCRQLLAQQSYLTCAGCSREVLSALAEIVLLYRVCVLDPEALVPSAVPGGSSASSVPRSKPPTSHALLDLTDRRPTVDGDPRDVHGVLAAWADAVREANDLPRRPRPRCRTAQQLAHGTVAGELEVLRTLWWWIRGHAAVVDLARTLFRIQDELRDLAGEGRGRVRIGRCVTPTADLDIDTGEPTPCGQLLLVRIGDRAVRCPRCTTTWPWSTWQQLAQQLAGDR